ncbi:MAG: group III truncated hemoglobin [Proteobacteria bacterium]|nr:group III truncated hemoglobin [Pseudomonadota bacterium]
MSNALPPRIDVTRNDIERVVASFYKRIRSHPVLGPVFAKSIPDNHEAWNPHEAKIANFWANAILHERSYSGNPMAVHMSKPDVHADHFPVWLDLFEATLRDTLTTQQADSFNAFARRIGRGLQMGLMYRDPDTDQPPNLL